MGHSPRDEPLIMMNATVVSWHSYMKPCKGGSPSVVEPISKGHNEENLCFSSLF